MQLSTKGRYAVMALADLAMQGGATVPLAAISERQEISLPYLEQIFLKLRRSGIVESARGPGGGYSLARPCAQITIAEVMSAVDEPVKMTRCSAEEAGCIGDHRCLTHDLWRALGDHIVAFLDRTTLADLVDNASARAIVHQARARSAGAESGKLAEGA